MDTKKDHIPKEDYKHALNHGYKGPHPKRGLYTCICTMDTKKDHIPKGDYKHAFEKWIQRRSTFEERTINMHLNNGYKDGPHPKRGL